MAFENDFTEWLAEGLAQPIPKSVCAFAFNLFEPAGESGVRFGIELVGASSSDKDDPDWACEEVWAPANRRLSIPEQYSGSDWQACLKKMKSLVQELLEVDTQVAQRLKRYSGVGIGFVDGDLEITWPNANS
ncbi:MAG: hypothetical protein AAGB00_08055 [Planctomycetota bacterium]